MDNRTTIQPVRTEDDLRAVAILFDEYAKSLPVDLDYQDFTTELASLPGKYAEPRGALLLARSAAGEALGCVGLRPLEADGACEMKRLYVRDVARGSGLGRALTEAVIDAARGRGYRELRLDTLPTMLQAQAMYRAMGFVEIAPYYAPVPAGTVFLSIRI